jgi:hypothetical protein
MTDRTMLRTVHDLRMKAHWGQRYDTGNDAWPQTEADWRQTGHGAPWDTNVRMAQWHLDFARKLQSEGLI